MSVLQQLFSPPPHLHAKFNYSFITFNQNFYSACSERSASIASGGNTSLGGHSTATIGAGAAGAGGSFSGTGAAAAVAGVGRDNSSQHDFPSLTISDDFPMELLHEFESASVYGNFFIVFCFLFCILYFFYP